MFKINIKRELRHFLFFSENRYSPTERIAFLLPFIFLLNILPISLVPTSLMSENSHISELISERYIDEFNKDQIHEITMTNMTNLVNGECYARQTLTKTSARTNKEVTYSYWVKYCTGGDGLYYDFKLVNDGNKLKLYTWGDESKLEEFVNISVWNFGVRINKPLHYFKGK